MKTASRHAPRHQDAIYRCRMLPIILPIRSQKSAHSPEETIGPARRRIALRRAIDSGCLRQIPTPSCGSLAALTPLMLSSITSVLTQWVCLHSQTRNKGRGRDAGLPRSTIWRCRAVVESGQTSSERERTPDSISWGGGGDEATPCGPQAFQRATPLQSDAGGRNAARITALELSENCLRNRES